MAAEKVDLKLIVKKVKLLRETKKTEVDSATATEHKDTIIAEVKKNLREPLKKLTQPQLIRLATPYLGPEDKIYQAGEQALKAGDEQTIRRVAEDMYGPNSGFKALAITHSTQILIDSLGNEVSRRKIRHLENSLKLDRKTGKIETPTAIRFIDRNTTTDNQALRIGLEYGTAQLAQAA